MKCVTYANPKGHCRLKSATLLIFDFWVEKLDLLSHDIPDLGFWYRISAMLII